MSISRYGLFVIYFVVGLGLLILSGAGATFAQATLAQATSINLGVGLVARYELEGNANDTSGNGHHGTAAGAVQFNTGACGAFATELAQGAHIQVPSHGLGDFSVTAWFRQTFDTGNFQRVWDFGSNG